MYIDQDCCFDSVSMVVASFANDMSVHTVHSYTGSSSLVLRGPVVDRVFVDGINQKV